MKRMMRLGALFLLPALLVAPALPADAAPAWQKKQVGPTKPTFNPVSVDKRKTRIFLPLKHVKIHKREAKVASWQLELTGQGLGTYSLDRSVPYGALHHLRVQSFEGKTYLRADWRHAAPVSVTVRPDGVEIFFYHKKATPHYSTVATGVRYWEGQRWSHQGPMRVRVLKLDPKHVRLAPGMPNGGESRMGTAPTSKIAGWNRAIAAINGGFFSPRTGEPQGTLIFNQTLLSRTMLDRPSLWIKRDGGAYIKVEKPAASVRLDDGSVIHLQAVNEIAKRDRITLYTDQYGPRTRSYPDPSRWEIAVNRDDVVVGEGHGNIAIPDGGYVLSGQGKGYFQLKNAIGFGQELQLQYAFNPEVQHAIGGGPMLLHNGQVQGVPQAQRFQGDVLWGRAPRSAVGMTHDGKYMLVTIDGRRPGYSVGATLSELAYTMKELGAVDALNLDGGGSTTMVVRNRVINRPSDGWERPVSTALLVLPRNDKQAAAPADDLLAFFQPMAD